MRIDVTFEIDADGIVSVTASDQATGQQASTTITLSSGLAEDQIEKLIENDVAGRVVTADGPPAPIAARAAAPKSPAPAARPSALPSAPPAARSAAPAPKPTAAPTPPAAKAAPMPAPIDVEALDGLDDLDLEGGDLDLLDEDLAPPPVRATTPPPPAEIELETEVSSGVDADGFFDRSGNDLSAPNPDEDLG